MNTSTLPEGSRWLYIISYVNTSPGFLWFFRELAQRGLKVNVLLLHWSDPEMRVQLEQLGHTCYYIRYNGKKDLPGVFLKVLRLIRQLKPGIVHTHLFDASLIGLTAAKIARVPIRVHTRHHATQHHVYSPGTVKYDRWINNCSTSIIAISVNIRNLLVEKEKVDASKIHVIYHGFDPVHFSEVDAVRVSALRSKYNLGGYTPVIGVVSRYTHWKGIQHIIPAFKKLLSSYPDALLFLSNARGDYSAEIRQQLKAELPEKSFREVDFEPDMAAMYHLFDIFVHVPVNDHAEAFGQVYVEALLASRPCIFTLSGIATEFIIDGSNAQVVPFEDPDAIYQKMLMILSDAESVRNLAIQGHDDAVRLFGIHVLTDKTLEVYAG